MTEQNRCKCKNDNKTTTALCKYKYGNLLLGSLTIGLEMRHRCKQSLYKTVQNIVNVSAVCTIQDKYCMTSTEA